MRLYSTLSGRKDEFQPQGDTVQMYVCGVTPYSDAHVGHAMSYVVFDVLRRYLQYTGHSVHHVQNITDVDDKIIQRGLDRGVDPLALAKEYTDEFLQDMDALNVLRAHDYPMATQEIPGIITIIQALVGKGCAYAVDGDVYFRVNWAEDYGKLSHRTLEGMQAGARIELDPRKEHPMDFALWKAAKPGEPSWDSPWGPGRPGWHIECTAMSIAYLGHTLDIHGGGHDLVFPHHENEIAQSEAYTGVKPFARWWVHNGLLQLGEAKMSKSIGNLITIRQALDTCSSDALRLFFLGSHYRGPLAYSEDALRAQERAVDRLRRACHTADTGHVPSSLGVEDYRNRFRQAMDDDLNTPQAIAVLFDLARDINRAREDGENTADARTLLAELSGVLGLSLLSLANKRVTASMRATAGAPSAAMTATSKSPVTPEHDGATNLEPLIELLIETRNGLRSARQFEMADRIRNRLGELGIALEDTPRGAEWRFTD